MTSAFTKSPRESTGNKSNAVFECFIHYFHTPSLILSPHPYIFFNEDNSVTVVGFMMNNRGDLVNPANQQVLKQAIIPPNLYKGPLPNRVNFVDDFHKWTKDVMIVKIATVMGVDMNMVYDPDPYYVLTADNVIKILTIQMRLR
jgi:hypothetical protein